MRTGGPAPERGGNLKRVNFNNAITNRVNWVDDIITFARYDSIVHLYFKLFH